MEVSPKIMDLRVPAGSLSLVRGASEPALLEITLGDLCELQAKTNPTRDAVVVAWSGARLTFRDMNERSKELAKGLLKLGIRRGARIAVFSGDDERYIVLFFAAVRIGACLVIFNKTYTLAECKRAIKHTDPLALFIAEEVNHESTDPLFHHLRKHTPNLKYPVRMRAASTRTGPGLTYEDVMAGGASVPADDLRQAESVVEKDDVANIQFTSGTTGAPKAAMLTHFGLLNNAQFIGDYLGIDNRDILCCPPPLYHCFGLVAGLLTAYTHGTTMAYANRDFDAAAVVDVLLKERCTVLHGVPTMFTAVMQHLRKIGATVTTLRTGIAAGTKVPPALLTELRQQLGFKNVAITYGMTETSPASFMTEATDTLEQRLETVGRVFPHVTAKVVDPNNRIVARGARGELCVSGWLLQKGYYKNPEKTAEAMIRDDDGVLWMHTGDEATIDEKGYCRITGRIKDIIIRGGENIYPLEVEERMLEHPSISHACVVGLQDKRYGEVVGAFLQLRPGSSKLSLDAVRDWVKHHLGRHKAPAYVFWVGPLEKIQEYPLTGNGKYRKEVLRELGNKLAPGTAQPVVAKL